MCVFVSVLVCFVLLVYAKVVNAVRAASVAKVVRAQLRAVTAFAMSLP
jgi:hypothetical protein